MADLQFANRLKTACDGNNSVPPYGKGRQTWLREQMDVSHEAVRKWFTGESRPRPAKMGQLAQLLGVDESWLALGITPDMGPKERKRQNAKATGAVNVFMGLLQLGGGHCAFPSEGDPAADYVSFHTIKEGTQTSYHVTTAQPAQDGTLRFTIPNEYERCAVVGAIPVGPAEVRFIRMPHAMIEEHASRKGGYLTVEVQEDAGRYVSGDDGWEIIRRLD